LARQLLIIKGGDNIRECLLCGKEVKFKDYIKYDGDSMEKTVFVWNPRPLESTFNEKTSIKKEQKNDEPEIYCKECYMKKKGEKYYKRYGKYISRWFSQLSKEEQKFLRDLISQTFQFFPKLPHYTYQTPGFTIRNKHIRTLNLSRMDLEKIPSSIGNLKSLKVLDISSNKLRILPKAIGDLYKLKILNLGYNRLRTIPKSCRNLRRLSQFLVPMNHFEKVPPELKLLPQITYLDISYNPIKKIPPFLENFPNLKIIYCLGLRARKDIMLEELYKLKMNGIILVT
jgi:Leucine-rich repeat (LRR) protein